MWYHFKYYSVWQPGHLLLNNYYNTTLEYNKHYHAFEVRREVRPGNVLIRQEMLAITCQFILLSHMVEMCVMGLCLLRQGL